MTKFLSTLPFLLLLAGCGDIQWARLLPPGLIKYEEIASEKEANPVIAAEIEQRIEGQEKEYPKLARQPGVAEVPEGKDPTQMESEISELTEARDTLEAQTAEDRRAAEEERLDNTELLTDGEKLDEDLENDKDAIARERR